jgi:hypothetical protein
MNFISKKESSKTWQIVFGQDANKHSPPKKEEDKP